MAVNLKKLSAKRDILSGGHRSCAGCAPATTLRQVLLGTDTPVVCSISTGCMEVATTIYPYSAWRCSYIHNAFENSAATMSGVESGYRALKKRGKMDTEHKFIAFGGDGGTYDIGFQSLSGAAERGHNMVYICYDNQAYMNTGIQRSSSTPIGAATSTTPAGKAIPGKQQNRKDITEVMVAHDIPYVAQTSVHNPRDLIGKVQKALAVEGFAFINILAPCHRGWRIAPEKSMECAKIATETCFWPLYEVEDGKYSLSYKPKEKLPVTEWIKDQGRYRHVFRDENKYIIDLLQQYVDRKWGALLAKCE